MSAKDPAMLIDSTAADTLAAIHDRRSARRRFLAYAAGGAASVGALSLLPGCGGTTTNSTVTPGASSTPIAITDTDLFNFALNLEFLEAQYYSYAVNGTGLATTPGVGTPGTVTGGAQVPFSDPLVAQYAREIAADETAHVTYIQSLLGGSAVAMPSINIDGISATGAFSLAAQAAGLVPAGGTFNPYASDENFLLGAFLFEDVGVSAYKGASPLITNKTYLEAAAGILATEAYHAGLIRSVLYRKGIELDGTIFASVQALSDARDSLDGSSDDDQGIGTATTANITPTDATGIAYSRSTGQVLNIVYLNKTAVKTGGFFPAGVNGNIFTAAASG